MKVSVQLCIICIVSLAWPTRARAEAVAIAYDLDSAVATIDPFAVPNPQGGADITISPALVLDAGSFGAIFGNADAAGTIADGDASIIGTEFYGALSIVLTSSIDVFGFPVPVRATLTGPFAAQQTSDSAGTLAGLSIYAETAPGDYDIAAGPLDCSDSFAGVFCTAIEAALGLTFPIDGLDSTAVLPFSGGTFSNLNPGPASGISMVTSQIDFSFPLTADISFGVEIDASWLETGRMTLVPEPSVVCLLIGAIGVCLRRGRERGRRFDL